MNLFDSPAGFDDPIGMWMGCHRRIEKQLRTLAKLPAHLASKGTDAEASNAAQSILRYFEKSGPHHHEDEDRDLFPLLEKRITNDEDLEKFRELRARLEDDHRRMEACWARLRKPLQGIADGIAKPLDAGDIESFRTIYAAHIPAEDGAIPDLAKRYLSDRDLDAMGRSMAARRGVAFPA
ncbi:MAG: hemerythrin domain-containing protein [Betaproteobacteria bacterium]|nr:hemerythrin domain-containing protein [Betaproteobacteria bacterium]